VASPSLKEIIRLALQEDLPKGDVTTDSLALKSRSGVARLVAKQDLILSGHEAFEEVIKTLDGSAKLTWYFKDSDPVLKGQHLCLIQGNLVEILKAERVALNLIGHLSGISTLTRKFADQVKHTKTKILDTRKTMPLLRDLERKAVRDGGGANHRLNLSDAIVIKENHIRAAGGIKEAITRIRSNSKLSIIIEVTNLEEVKEAVELKAERLLLDNMTNELMTQALKMLPASTQTEASGNMKIDRVRSVAELGIDYISVGLLTHSAPAADISLLFEWS
jgi:nicotinate-nucleotide pyrophosphorylase (carboxylating)